MRGVLRAAPPSVAHGAVTFAIALPLQPVASWSGLMALAPLAFVFLPRLFNALDEPG